MKFYVPLLLVLLAATPAASRDWRVDPAASRLTFEGAKAGDPFVGRWTRWSSTISFDPHRPEHASILIEIDMASARTGDATIDPMLPQADWFDSRRNRWARFTAKGLRPLGGERYEMAGVLSVKNTRTPVKSVVRIVARGTEATAAGELQIDRRSVGIGMEADPKAQWVAAPVKVRFSLRAVSAR